MAFPIGSFVAFLSHTRARFLLIACGLLVGLVLAGSTAVVIRQMHRNALAAAQRELSNMSLALAEQTDHGFQAVETVELSLIEHMRQVGIDTPEEFVRQMSAREVQSSLRDRIVGVPQVQALILIDRNGRLINFSRDQPLRDVNVADRDYFQALSGSDPPTSFISEPVESRSTGASTFYIVHRFSAPDGAFIGLVVGAFDPHYFEEIFSRMSHDSAAAITLQRRDGVLLARYPPIPGNNGRSLAQTANFQRLIAATDHGIVHIHSMLDGQDRLLAPSSLSHYPVLLIAGTTSEQAMDGWRDQSLLLAAGGGLLEVFLCGLIVLSIRQMRAQQLLAAGATEKLASDKARMLAESNLVLADLKLRHAEESKRSQRALNTQAMRFELALRNMQQGLMMFDDAGRLLVVNRPFCRLFGLESDALTAGMSYADVTGRIVELGNVTERDMRGYRETRAKLISGNEAATATWEFSDGRAFTVTHQAMEGGWLSTYEDITEHRKTAAKIAHLANHDALTGLANRVLFHERLEHGLTYARRGHLLALHCLDLDQFKTVNDTLGHPIGDRLLQAVAGRLLGHLRETDTVARLGGDEFAIVQSAIGSPTDASQLADKLIALIEAPFEIDGNQIIIGTSIGIAFAPHDGLDADQLLKCADLALYRAKLDGRGVYRLFHADMDASMQARRALELDLRGALRDRQFELFYQPLVDLRSKRVAGFEALLRWRHPTRGIISPDQFIPLCEETGMIVQIGEWVLREACATAAGWQGNLKVAVNLSAVQFKSHDLVATIVAALHESGLHPSRLELEITETVMLHETDSTLTTLHRLQELGIRVAMDDFGTGYSSLSYLRLFPFDRVKIDQSFVRELGKQADCMAIVRAVATLGNDLGMAVTAEGVETTQQFETLERAGCTEVQGYLFSRPVPGHRVVDLVRAMSMTEDVVMRFADDALSGSTEMKVPLPAL